MTAQEQAAQAIIWLDGLCSGKHPQGRGKLGDKDSGYCCWGLGCELVGVPYDPSAGWNDKLGEHIGWKGDENNWGVVPYEGEIYLLLGTTGLAQVNDDYFKTFLEIGTALKTYPEEAFIPEVAAIIREHYKLAA